jgi:hypothetical protein
MSLGPRISDSLPEKEVSGEGIGREETCLGYYRHFHGLEKHRNSLRKVL